MSFWKTYDPAQLLEKLLRTCIASLDEAGNSYPKWRMQ